MSDNHVGSRQAIIIVISVSQVRECFFILVILRNLGPLKVNQKWQFWGVNFWVYLKEVNISFEPES